MRDQNKNRQMKFILIYHRRNFQILLRLDFFFGKVKQIQLITVHLQIINLIIKKNISIYRVYLS